MKLDYDLHRPEDEPLGLGLIVLQADETIEPDFRRLMPQEGLRLLHNRIPSPASITAESLPEMAKSMTATAALFPPGSNLSVIGYACTSGTAAMGEATVERLVREGFPGVVVTNPLSALKAALSALNLNRIAVVNPYIGEVAERLCDALSEEGAEVTATGSFRQMEDRLVARIEPESIFEAVLKVGRNSDCEGIVVSCTNLRAVEVMQRAEAALGKPVLVSNQALAWHMLRLGGWLSPVAALGCLSGCSLPRPAAA